ncbi:ABC1-domain-containing protein [Dichomitus squalens LYAD-421 SS1]|uniref:ABC1-domain-containing protein n=1 Tax=Dichomitus squalens (strain LYAD-421) TaxID=732165 RepID=UPI000441540F|nr:ABC1-domain-containing protein [Dichomitus squalens LYAD-421 SS1]EJF66849.1 ABC1-domain-containing protein [Dichomitus squalens LYAD-421 SS1]
MSPIALRLLLRPGLRQPLLARGASTFRQTSSWTQTSQTFSSQFFTRTRTAAPSSSFSRKLLWIIPVTGGIAFLAAPARKDNRNVFASPNLIPCSEAAAESLDPVIMSPYESDRTLLGRIRDFLRDRILEPVLTAQRFVYLCFLFVPVLLTAPMLLIGPPESKLGGDRWGAVWWYGFLTRQMQYAGPTFIKLAQWAASRADLFPALLCERMGALHSRGKAHTLAHTKRVIEQVFQRPFEDVFEEFDETPIGTGAIAQVYRATLKHDLIPPSHLAPKRSKRKAVLPPSLTNEPPPSVPTASVAIKVLHPRVAQTINRDLRIMSFFANVITLIPGMQWISLPEEAEVFGGMMHEQLDLRIEAENLAKFEKNFEGRKLPVSFPRPLQLWSTKDLLVEEYENALPLEWFLANGGGPFNDTLAEVGLDAFLNMLLLDNFVHSDLHPGNIMIKFVEHHNRLKASPSWFPTLFEKEDVPTSKSDKPSSSDALVNELRALTHDQDAWRARLAQAKAEGFQPEIVFVDAGLVTTLNAVNRKNFIDLFRAVAEFDGYRAGILMVERCRTPELAIDTETFALRMQHIVLNVKRKTFSLGQIKISDILKEVLKAVRKHHVKMEGDFINTVISILLLEGIGRQLDPRLDLFKSALPILRQLGRQMSTQETMAQMPSGQVGAFLKLWVVMEARELASAALVNADDLVKYDWLTPAI